jgi:hypothetical protein
VTSIPARCLFVRVFREMAGLVCQLIPARAKEFVSFLLAEVVPITDDLGHSGSAVPHLGRPQPSEAAFPRICCTKLHTVRSRLGVAAI